jgi:hypothetical protein
MEQDLLGLESVGFSLDFLENAFEDRRAEAVFFATEQPDVVSVIVNVRVWTPTGATASTWTPINPT